MTEDSGHVQLLAVMISIQVLIGGGLWWAIRSVWSSVADLDKYFRTDHVHLPEFVELRAKVDRIAESQASVIAKLGTLERKLERLEDLLMGHVRGDNPGQS
jgi:hypothetical protein